MKGTIKLHYQTGGKIIIKDINEKEIKCTKISSLDDVRRCIFTNNNIKPEHEKFYNLTLVFDGSFLTDFERVSKCKKTCLIVYVLQQKKEFTIFED